MSTTASGTRTSSPRRARPSPVGREIGAPDQPAETYRSKLDRALDALNQENPQAFTDLVAWCRLANLAPDQGEDACRQILQAMHAGEAYRPTTIREALNETPEELLRRLLGATVVDRIPVHSDRVRQERDALERRAAATNAREEDRADARTHMPAGAGDRSDRGRAAREAARAAIAKEPRQ